MTFANVRIYTLARLTRRYYAQGKGGKDDIMVESQKRITRDKKIVTYTPSSPLSLLLDILLPNCRR